MHLIIGVLIGIVFTGLLVKAILETLWGLCLIAYGRILIVVASILLTLAKVIRLITGTRRKPPVVETPQRISISRAFSNAHR